MSETQLVLGHVVATAAVDARIKTDEQFKELVFTSLRRHSQCDWGDVSTPDEVANDAVLAHGERILSVYGPEDDRIWIITEADRSSTTVLYPHEY